MLAFLHTAETHLETFRRLAAELDATVPTRHVVRSDLLAAARAGSANAANVNAALASALQRLVTVRARRSEARRKRFQYHAVRRSCASIAPWQSTQWTAAGRGPRCSPRHSSPDPHLGVAAALAAYRRR